MKLTFKDLKQQKFQIEAEPTETIGAVKEKIKGEKGWEPSTQKLIYSGKILQDDNTIESYKIEEKGFIVCMTSKPKAAPKPVTGPSTPAQASSTPAAPAAPIAPPQGLAATATANPPATPTPAPTSAAPTATDSTTFNDPSALTMGDQRTAAIANMEAMGFPRDQIDQAMRAAFFNPDRAVQYLLEGIPENIQQEQAAAAQQRAAARAPAPASGNTAAPETAIPAPSADAAGDEPVNLFETAATQRSAAGAGTGAGAGAGAGARATGAPGAGQQAGTANLDFLRTNPQFVQLRQLVQQQPQMLEMILQQLSLNEPGHRATVAAANPQLTQIISSNPDQFMELLAEGGDDEEGSIPPGAHQIAVTQEESDAIDRLCGLGFERNAVITAYFACDKNEELAANFLFESPDDGGDDLPPAGT